MRRFTAVTYEENMASRRVLEKLGMALARRFRMTSDDMADVGTFHIEFPMTLEGEELEYALEKADWENQGLAGAQQT